MIRQESSLSSGNKATKSAPFSSRKDGGRIVFSVNATKIDGYADLMGFKGVPVDQNDDISKKNSENKSQWFDLRCSNDFRLAGNACEQSENVVQDEGQFRISRKLSNTTGNVGLCPKQSKSALKSSTQRRRENVQFGHWSDSMVPPLNKHQTSAYHRDCRTLGIIRDRGDGVPNLRAAPVRSVTFLSDTESCGSIH